jgi:hypothetical protein
MPGHLTDCVTANLPKSLHKSSLIPENKSSREPATLTIRVPDNQTQSRVSGNEV